MDRRALVGTLAGGLLAAAPLIAQAQRRTNTPRIGFLSFGSGPNPNMDIFQGLHELGWVEGQTVPVEYRWAAGKESELATLAAELVRLMAGSFSCGRSAIKDTHTVSLRAMADWLVAWGCGWGRECVSRWAAESVRKLHPGLAGTVLMGLVAGAHTAQLQRSAA